MSPSQKPRLAAVVRQQQRLTLTPQVRQTIEMLSMPMTELQMRVEQELVENPALEEVLEGEEESDDEDAPAPEAEAESADGAADGTGEEARQPTAEEVATAPEKDAMAEIETRDFFAENYENTGGLALSEEPPPLERTLPAGRTLAEHLREQLGLAVSSEAERAVGLHIIGNLDERGYLDASVDDLARSSGASPDEVEAVRQQILRFDPTGCACLDLRECLLAQVEAREGDTALLEKIVADHLEQVMAERFREVAEATGAEPDAVLRAIRRIGELSFRPGEAFAAPTPYRVVPDARAYRFNGEWRVEMNDSIPRLRASPAYREVIGSPREHTAEEQKFAREAWYRAKGFRRSVEQRQLTVRLVAEDIVRKQTDFLSEGIDRIRPLVLADVARDIGRAESTVSRVVSNKYLQTPRGIVPFRRFFHSALALRDGRQVSSEAVRARIRRIVEREDPEFPLADDQIVQLLDREGIIIARRTVAKYRKAMRIPSSNDRRARHRHRLPEGASRSGRAG